MTTHLRAPVPSWIKDLLRRTVLEIKRLVKERGRLAARRALAMRYYQPRLDLINAWVPQDTELSNFYYELTEINLAHLAGFVSAVTNTDVTKVADVLGELDDDVALREHLRIAMAKGGVPRDTRFAYGRRLGWYAIARLIKPRVIIETGVDDGVGSCVLSAALLRNASEGRPGKYYGTEIRTDAGHLLSGRYSEVGKIIYGDSIASLRTFDEPIDLFINDSDHSADYEYEEYRTISAKLAAGAVILGDNSHSTDRLYRFAAETGRNFLFFREAPKDHWYPGAGIGAAFRRAASR